MHLEICEAAPESTGPNASSLSTVDIASLYRKHRHRAFSIAWAYLKDEEEALDAVQEAFIKAQRNGDRFNGRSSPQTWLYRIVINVCLDMRRRKSRRPELHVEDVDIVEPRPCSFDCPEKGVEDLELRNAIYEGLRRLSDNHRVVLVLREFSGLNYEQIAELEGCPKGTVMSRLFHARRQLRQLLGRQLDYPLPLLASVA
jgi:RNA polymerase sigma-70 factor (ECF subfamily)